MGRPVLRQINVASSPARMAAPSLAEAIALLMLTIAATVIATFIMIAVAQQREDVFRGLLAHSKR